MRFGKEGGRGRGEVMEEGKEGEREGKRRREGERQEERKWRDIEREKRNKSLGYVVCVSITCHN